MHFELEPENRGQPDETLLADLRSVASKLGLASVSRAEYETHGRFHPKTLVKRFGTWTTTLEKAGLERRKTPLVSEAELLEDIASVAARLGTKNLSTEQYGKFGRFSLRPVARLFGTWDTALSRVGLRPGSAYNRPHTEAELHENLATVWRFLGRQPKQSDMRQPLSVVGHEAYNRRFGSWRKALEAFVAVMNRDQPSADSRPDAQPAEASTPDATPVTVQGRARTAGWRLRFLVLRRDGFRCRQCGASPAVTPGTVLVVDHVNPWSLGGQTVIENLQTLCEPCNGGKGATRVGDS